MSICEFAQKVLQLDGVLLINKLDLHSSYANVPPPDSAQKSTLGHFWGSVDMVRRFAALRFYDLLDSCFINIFDGFGTSSVIALLRILRNAGVCWPENAVLKRNLS